MTKEQYYDMCEALGNEPDPKEVPVEFDDLHIEVQEAYDIYIMLQDMWDPMNGNYLGKNFSGLLDILALNGVDDTKLTFIILKKLDEYRGKAIRMNKKAAK